MEGTHPAPAGEGEGAWSLRHLLLAVIHLGMIGLIVELLLIGHTESVWQWIPLVALGCGLASAVSVAARPSPRTLGIFRALMAVFVAAGLLGLYLHFDGNVEFERENDPTVRGTALVWEALRGATPTLAPGALAQLGLLGLIYAFRHPALGRRARSAPPP